MATDRTWLAPIVATIVGFGALHGGSAAAEPVIDVDAVGEASGGGDDLRSRALDDGFARAVEGLLGDELGVTESRRHRDQLRQRITRRARLYVVSFRVRDQVAGEGTVRVEISARIDLGKLRAALAELDLGRGAAPPARARPRVVVLLHATWPGSTGATFGTDPNRDGGIAGKSFVAALTDLGFEVVTAAGKPAPVTRQTGGKLPMDGSAALALARAVDAGGAFVVGVELSRDGTIRGTRLAGAIGVAEVRVYADDGAEVAHAEVAAAGYAPAAADAIAASARAVVDRTIDAIADPVTGYWPAPRRIDDASAIVLRGARRWSTVEAVLSALRGSRGVSAVTPRSFGRGEVGLAVVTSLEPARLAALVQNVRIDGVVLTATGRGRLVEVDISETIEANTEVAP